MLLKCFRFHALLLLSVSLTACLQQESLAPVLQAQVHVLKQQSIHRVRAGETLYAIAFRYDLDYQQLARINQLKSPYNLSIGQMLRLQGRASTRQTVKAKARLNQQTKRSHTRRIATNKAKKISRKNISAKQTSNAWRFPAHGSIWRRFNLSQGSKGIDIAGRLGSAVIATSAGRVAYSGNGLRGYGNLIIIKHSSSYLSAYAFNRRNRVHEGQWVKAGQVIAEMGHSRNHKNKALLHFEIRKNGKPVDPLRYVHAH